MQDRKEVLYLHNDLHEFTLDLEYMCEQGPLVGDPYAELDSAEINAIPDDSELQKTALLHWQQVRYIEQALLCDPMTGFHLVTSALQGGYNPRLHSNRVASWIVGRIAATIDKHESLS